jgi:hypothetical protein
MIHVSFRMDIEKKWSFIFLSINVQYTHAQIYTCVCVYNGVIIRTFIDFNIYTKTSRCLYYDVIIATSNVVIFKYSTEEPQGENVLV